jgi:chemosensory pili system protein ChpE
MQLPVAMAGAAYLAYLAWDSWAASNAPIQSSASHKANIKTSAKSTQSAARAGVIISATNPQNIAYWAAIGSAFGALGITQPQPLDYALFFSGFMLSSLLWCFFCAALVSKLFGKAGNKWKVITYRLCAIAFFYLACGTLYKAIANFG